MSDNLYRTPDSDLVAAPLGVTCVGFWLRVVATVLDSMLMVLITLPLGVALYGSDYLASEQIIHGPADVALSFVLPAIAVLAFWHYRSATPGKMALRATIVDARSGGKPTLRQYLLRYVGYIAATLPLGLGILWVAIDPRKQGWHDKLAGTVVVRPSLGNRPNADVQTGG